VSEELRIVDPTQVAVYKRLAEQLWSVAVEGEGARALLLRVLSHLGQVNG
jgi:hypothetical protein